MTRNHGSDVLSPSGIVQYLRTKADLSMLQRQLKCTENVTVLRRRIVKTARQPEFSDAVLHTVPEPLWPACRPLLGSWFIPGDSDRHQLARLRRVISAIDGLRVTYTRACRSPQPPTQSCRRGCTTLHPPTLVGA